MTNFTNNFELNKAHHDSFFKKASENDIEKGGEGSRGGKVIGHTESGKPIYENHDHPAHKNFTSNDHTDAVYAHVNLTSRKSLATKEEKKKHLEEGKKHGASSHTAKQDPDSLDEYKQEEDKAKKNSEGTKSLHKFSVSAQLKQQGGGSYVKHEVQARDEEHALDQVGEMYQPHGNTQFVRGNSKATKVEKSIDSDSLQKAFEVLGLPDTYDQIEKGGKPALVGEIRDFGGKKMIKTKMGSNSWRPYFPGGKHEHLTSGDKKEPAKEEVKTEPRAEKKEPESPHFKELIKQLSSAALTSLKNGFHFNYQNTERRGEKFTSHLGENTITSTDSELTRQQNGDIIYTQKVSYVTANGAGFSKDRVDQRIGRSEKQLSDFLSTNPEMADKLRKEYLSMTNRYKRLKDDFNTHSSYDRNHYRVLQKRGAGIIPSELLEDSKKASN